jgi:EAL domain-containing protein (putative c-di-GMP-specific phosphodiesterase class I)/CHASE2 domain-containing sensor protein
LRKILYIVAKNPARAYFAGAVFAAVFLTLIANFAGIGNTVDHAFTSVRSEIFHKHASNKIVVVEFDAKSIQRVGTWPWPRDVHAQLVERLSSAGAEQIAFDVDFSATSNPASDKRFAEAIAKSSATIILATFRQKSSSQSNTAIENLPLAEFRNNAILASVNVHPNDYGQVAMYSYGEITGDTLRPSMGALITSSTGRLGDSFPIDQSIDPSTITAVSAVDILEGKVGSEVLNGKTVLIGASAIELGDFYSTPHHGIIPGVFLHALAAETLQSGYNMPVFNDWPAIGLVILLLIAGTRWMPKRKTLMDVPVAPVVTGAVICLLNITFYITALADFAIGNAIVLLINFVAISMIIRSIENMQRERYRDHKTGLPNSMALIWLGRRLERKHPISRLAVLQIANYTEVHGLCTTDQWADMLRSSAGRLRFLTLNDRVFKVGDDQLAWVVPEDYAKNLGDYFETISAFFLAPFSVGTKQIRLNIHCGFHASDTKDWPQLQSNATIAAYKAAELGYRWLPYSNDINAVAQQKMTILNDIEDAMDNGDIWVAYQPKMDTRTNSIASAEALARWQHPELGNIRPDHFIPLLENAGKITDLTLYMLRQMLFDLENWRAKGLRMSSSINISVALLDDKSFVEESLSIISQTMLDKEQITFEITETASVKNLDDAGKVLARIRATGVRVSIDDYGTGQSTLSYLRDFPADEIKIDQAFIRNMTGNELDRVMVTSTIDLAHQMHFKVVAEGVEDEATLQLLKSQGCDLVQGWHIGKPVNVQLFEQEFMNGDMRKSATA